MRVLVLAASLARLDGRGRAILVHVAERVDERAEDVHAIGRLLVAARVTDELLVSGRRGRALRPELVAVAQHLAALELVAARAP